MSQTNLITEGYTETINSVADHLRAKHPDCLLLFQHREDGIGKLPKPYYWCSRSYSFLLGHIINPVPVASAEVLNVAKTVATQMNKSVVIIDNTVTVLPYCMVIHPLPLKEPTNEQD